MAFLKDSLEIVDDIMDRVIQTGLWTTVQLTNPMIKEAEAEFDKKLDQLKAYAPEDLVEETRDAAWGIISAFDYPAILYGIRVAMAFRDVCADPNALSQHIIDRAAERGDGGM